MNRSFWKGSLWKYSIAFQVLVTVLSTVTVGCVRQNRLDNHVFTWLASEPMQLPLMCMLIFGVWFSVWLMVVSTHFGMTLASCMASLVGLLIARDLLLGMSPEGTILVSAVVLFFISAYITLDDLFWAILYSIPFIFQAAVIGLTASAVHMWLPLMVFSMVYAMLIWLFYFGLRWETKNAPA
jgi:hypothetical protein